MKKAGIILLLLLYACTQFSAVVLDCYKPLLHTVSKLKWRLRSSHHFVSIEIDVATYHQLLQEDDEIWWQGSMHDIEEMHLKGNTVQLLLEKDEDETTGLAAIEAHKKQVQHAQQAEKHSTIMGVKWLTELFTFAPEKLFIASPTLKAAAYPIFPAQFLKNPFISGIIHPPDGSPAFS